MRALRRGPENSANPRIDGCDGNGRSKEKQQRRAIGKIAA
jgi:hypothetical protein